MHCFCLLLRKKGHAINTGKVLRGAPRQIVIFSLGMYTVVYGLRNAGLTHYLSSLLNQLAEQGLWAATLGTGFLTAFLSSVMNNMPTVLVGALSIDGSTATGVIKEAMIYANVIGGDLGPKLPYRQSGNVTVAARSVAEKYQNYTGILLPGGHCHDNPRAVCHACSTGASSVFHFVMRY